jgi:hypothetical protein
VLERVLLRRVEFEFEGRRPGFDARDVKFRGFLDDVDQAALDQCVQR